MPQLMPFVWGLSSFVLFCVLMGLCLVYGSVMSNFNLYWEEVKFEVEANWKW